MADMREQRSRIGRGGAFLASWNRSAYLKSLTSRFRQFGNFNPSVGSHRARVSPEPKENRSLAQACPGVDMNMQVGPLISQYIEEDKCRISQQRSWAEEFDSEGFFGTNKS